MRFISPILVAAVALAFFSGCSMLDYAINGEDPWMGPSQEIAIEDVPAVVVESFNGQHDQSRDFHKILRYGESSPYRYEFFPKDGISTSECFTHEGVRLGGII